MSMLRPLFLIESTHGARTPIASLAQLVGVKASAQRCYRSQILRGENSKKRSVNTYGPASGPPCLLIRLYYDSQAFAYTAFFLKDQRK